MKSSSSTGVPLGISVLITIFSHAPATAQTAQSAESCENLATLTLAYTTITAAIQCAGGEGSSCLTAPQVEAARKIYAGPRNPLTRQQIFPAPQPGSELSGTRTTTGEQPFRLATDFFKYFVYKDPNWDFKTRPVDFAKDLALADTPENLVVNAIGPHIHEFVARGGKLLMWEGWNNTCIPPGITIDYYNSVVTGSAEKTAQHACGRFVPIRRSPLIQGQEVLTMR